MFQVNKDVPLPKKSNAFPFNTMAVGDSFDIQLGSDAERVEAEVNKWRTKLSLAKKAFQEEVDPTFNVKSSYLKRENLLRVWKVDPKSQSEANGE